MGGGGAKQKKNPCKQKMFEKKYMQTKLFKKKLQTEQQYRTFILNVHQTKLNYIFGILRNINM